MASNEVTTTAKRRQLAACSDIYEEKGNVILKMEMPGVTKEHLEVKIDNDILMIRGKREALAAGQGTYIIREIRDGDYYHEYTLDNTIDRNKIDAVLEKGILTLTLSLKESEKPRKINVVSA